MVRRTFVAAVLGGLLLVALPGITFAAGRGGGSHQTGMSGHMPHGNMMRGGMGRMDGRSHFRDRDDHFRDRDDRFRDRDDRFRFRHDRFFFAYSPYYYPYYSPCAYQWYARYGYPIPYPPRSSPYAYDCPVPDGYGSYGSGSGY